MGRSSLIGRLNYAYRSKYLFEATVRYDGSAKFDKHSRWGVFPSVSAGWRISEEPFIKDNTSVIDNLKLRAGFSMTGYDGVANFDYLAGYVYGSSYIIGSQAVQGLTATGLANPMLSWEQMKIWNVGLDFGLFHNRLYGEADVFYRVRDGIPGSRAVSLPDTFGATLPTENLNSINTRGFEFTLGYKGAAGDFRYNVAANISWARSKWGYYDEPEYTDPDEIRLYKKTGNWIDRDFGYRSNGLFTSQEEIDALDYRYLDGSDNSFLKQGDVHLLNTNGDDVLNWRDQVEIGKGTMPHWMAGLNLDLAFKGFDLSALFPRGFRLQPERRVAPRDGFPRNHVQGALDLREQRPSCDRSPSGRSRLERLGIGLPSGQRFVPAPQVDVDRLYLSQTLDEPRQDRQPENLRCRDQPVHDQQTEQVQARSRSAERRGNSLLSADAYLYDRPEHFPLIPEQP